MPILTKLIAEKLAERAQDKVHNAISTSIWGKVTSQGDLKPEEMTTFAKTQKKGHIL